MNFWSDYGKSFQLWESFHFSKLRAVKRGVEAERIESESNLYTAAAELGSLGLGKKKKGKKFSICRPCLFLRFTCVCVCVLEL